MSDLPQKVKLKTKISIFPKGYEMELRGGMYRKLGAIHGLSKDDIREAIENGDAEAIKSKNL